MTSYKEFYEDLALWGVLTAGQDQKVATRPTVWHRFLDDLCHLCDTEPGGKTVVSIAVSVHEDVQCFRIAANSKLVRAERQLCWILSELLRLPNSPQRAAMRIQGEVLDFVVCRSARRVRNYMNQLRLHIRELDGRRIGRGSKWRSFVNISTSADSKS
jgi:hypothetical protein